MDGVGKQKERDIHMTNKTELRQIQDAYTAYDEDSAPMHGVRGAGPDRKSAYRGEGRFPSVRLPRLSALLGVGGGAGADTAVMEERRVRAFVRGICRLLAVLLLGALFASAYLAYDMQPLGIAFVCASTTSLPAVAVGAIISYMQGGNTRGLYLSALVLCIGIRYAIGRFLCVVSDRRIREAGAGRYRIRAGDEGGSLAWLGRAILPSGVFTQSTALRVGVGVIAACPIAAGLVLGAEETVRAVMSALFLLCAIPIFTYLFCGFFDLVWEDGGQRDGALTSAARREGGIGAVCYALTASMGGVLFFGFSLRMLCAHAITLYISKRGGYLRGGLCGLLCGFACDAFYAPAYALIGAVSGLFFTVHAAPAVVLSLCAGAAYAVYIGEFAAIRSVVPEMAVVSAAAYPMMRYLPQMLSGLRTEGHSEEKRGGAAVPYTNEEKLPSPQILGIGTLAEELDVLSGILMGLSATFYHLSDRVKRPTLQEIRQICETTAESYCAGCAQHEVCWKKEFSSTADAMGRITLCIHRKGRAEMSAAFAPLDRRCPSLQNMLAAMNEGAAVLCEEKITTDKTEVAAQDYEGMAKLLRASAEENASATAKDTVLSGRMERAMARIGFRAKEVAVYGKRRRTVVATGVDLGMCAGRGELLLGSEDVRQAFSALAGVRYQPPDYRLTDGGRTLVMTMRAQPKLSVRCGSWGEKRAGEEVTGDVVTLFANRSDYFYALVCDGMGSGRDASVTAQIASLFLEKLLSVSRAKGAILNLLNGFLRSRAGEISATVDLCEIDLITSEARFIKCGAAPSYLLRGENLFRVASGTVPVGILREVSAEETALTLSGGDMLLFFSDGVVGEYEDAAWISETVKKALEDYEKRRVQNRFRRLTEDRALGGETAVHRAVSGERGDVIPLSAEETKEHVSGGEIGQSGTDAAPDSLPAYIASALGAYAAKRVGRGDDMTVAVVMVDTLT